MSTFYNLNIKEVINETPDAVSIVFDIPTNLEKEFDFVAGQYITLKTTLNNTEIRRAYSLCSSPNSNEVKVAVKKVENGTFSVYATSQLKVGDVLEVSKPEGRFILEPKNDKNYIGFCAGSGITPVLSMIKSVLESDTNATFTLIFGNKSVADTIFYTELNNLKAQYSSRFNLNFLFSREQQNEAIFGRIDKAHTNYFVKNIYKNIVFNEAFLCGPEEMINIVSATLQENGFSSENIKHELFTTSIDEEKATEVKDGETEITILLDDEETVFTMSQKKDILTACLDKNIDAPYSCQGGVCSNCLAKVTQGKAVMVKNQILTDDEVEDGLILTCQAHPTTEKIAIDFDEV